MYKEKKYTLVFGLLLLSILFILLYKMTYSYATIQFEINVLKSKAQTLNGQIYYTSTGKNSRNTMQPFILRNTLYGEYQTVSIPVTQKNITSIRLDPLPDVGEVIIKNFAITQGAWFNEITQVIDLSKVDFETFHNIEIIKKDKNILHIKALGSDPYLLITRTINQLKNIVNYKHILITLFISFMISMILLSIFYLLSNHYLYGSEVTLAVILLLYSSYTFLYGIHFIFAHNLIILFPLLGLYIMYIQGFKTYFKSVKNIILILIGLSIIVFIVDYVNGVNRFAIYLQSLKNIIIPAMFLSIIFIQKRKFNYYFYKYFLLTLTLFLALFSTLLHYHIIQIDTIMTFGYRMSMSAWAEKNYTFWYLFLMWGTISFFHFNQNRKKDTLIIFLIFIMSYIAIMSGYSDSAKLALIVSSIIYLFFSFHTVKLKTLMLIPVLISLYIIATPWISDIYVFLSDLHPRLQGRESIFAIYSSMIKENMIFGYGFNINGTLNPSEHVSTEIIERYSDNTWLYKCVPHSVLLFLWLDFGLVGITFFTFIVYKAMQKMLILTYHKNNQASLLALVSSFLIIITFSWGNWMSYSLLTFSFFTGMIFLSLNINSHNLENSKK